MRSRTARRGLKRSSAGLGILGTTGIALAAAVLSMTSADAALTDAWVTPGSGARGSTVTVSGAACLPGLLFNPSQAGVLGLTLGVNITVPVSASGEWSVQFVVPDNALEGLHAIVATCTRDLVSLPYLPLTFTVDAEAPVPTTTVGPSTTVTTTVTSTTAPLTTLSTASGSSTTLPPTEVLPGKMPFDGGIQSSGTPPGTVPLVPAQQSTTTTAETATTSTSRDGSTTTIEAVVSGRAARDDRGRSLVFGSLTPIGRGWIGWLVSALIVALVVSGLLAILWFRWLRHTRAREWWLRWFNQVLHIRSHARPPT
jgi:hypothetical protein